MIFPKVTTHKNVPKNLNSLDPCPQSNSSSGRAQRWLRRKRSRLFHAVLEWWRGIVKYTRIYLKGISEWISVKNVLRNNEGTGWIKRIETAGFARQHSLHCFQCWLLPLSRSLTRHCHSSTKKTPNLLLHDSKISRSLRSMAFHSAFESRTARSSDQRRNRS